MRSAFKESDALLCRCGYQFTGGEELVAVREPLPDPEAWRTKPALYSIAAITTALVGVVTAVLIGPAILQGSRRPETLSGYLINALLFLALLAFVFYGTLALSRALANPETGLAMKTFAMILYALGSVVVVVSIIAAGCAASFHIGG